MSFALFLITNYLKQWHFHCISGWEKSDSHDKCLVEFGKLSILLVERIFEFQVNFLYTIFESCFVMKHCVNFGQLQKLLLYFMNCFLFRSAKEMQFFFCGIKHSAAVAKMYFILIQKKEFDAICTIFAFINFMPHAPEWGNSKFFHFSKMHMSNTQ